MAGKIATQAASPLAMLSKQPMTALENFAGNSPWLQFMHTQCKNVIAVSSKLGNLPNGTPVYCGPGNEFVKCDPFVFIATPSYFQGYGLFDGAGNVVDYMEAGTGSRAPKDFAEIVTSFVILEVPSKGLTPCRIEFRRAYTKGFKSVVESINGVSKPEWKDYNRENKQIYALSQKLAIPPWAMLVHSGTTRIVPKPPPGFPYGITDISSATTSTAMLQSLATAMKDEAFNAQCTECLSDIEKRIASFSAAKKS